MLRGPRTNTHGTRRLSRKLGDAQEHHEAVLNYRRDGTPFMNLLMVTPLFDTQGKTRYFLGSQIDVSGLLDDFYGFEYLHKFLDREGYVVKGEEDDMATSFDVAVGANKDELRELSELLTPGEVEHVQRHGGRLHRPDMKDPGETEDEEESQKSSRLVLSESTLDALEEEHDSRLVLEDDPTNEEDAHADDWNDILGHNERPTPSTTDVTPRQSLNNHRSTEPLPNGHQKPTVAADADRASIIAPSLAPSFDDTLAQHGGQLGAYGLYDHYLLVRPAPSLRILFASPSLLRETPAGGGLVKSRLMERVGGCSAQMRGRIEHALTRGRRVTARVRWMPPGGGGAKEGESGAGLPSPAAAAASAGAEARNRWLHATPLLGKDNEVGVWMVVLVDEERGLRGAGAEGKAWSERMLVDEGSRPGTASSVSVSVAGGTRSFLRSSQDPASIILGLNSARNKGPEGSVAGSEVPVAGDVEP